MMTPNVAAPALRIPTPDALVEHPEYRRQLDWLYSLSPEVRPAVEIVADKPRKVPRTQALLRALGDPQAAFTSLLVAGTKGKGSTAAMIESMLRAAGHRTGLYTQPHLHSWCERTRVGGAPIDHTTAADVIAEARGATERLMRDRPELGQPTTFEVGTACTMLAFARLGVTSAVVEVGVGGAHDATNALEPVLVALAPVSYDHMATLGSTLEAIATEKAGLFRPGGRAVVGLQAEEAWLAIQRIAAERGTRVEALGREWTWEPADARPASGRFHLRGPGLELRDLEIPLLGRHQRDNAALAVAALHGLERPAFAVDAAAIRKGLAAVDWPGRAQVVGTRPWIVVDGAHNADSAQRLVDTVRECFAAPRRHLVIGASAGKDVAGMLDALLPLADSVTVTQSHHGRALAATVLASLVETRGARPRCEPRIGEAIDGAVADARRDDLVVVTGSLFLVAEAIEHFALPNGRDDG
ncbi:MAG: folylpolyglutamate synthase/dihydrofolate synthase family protein [Chloroflexota bacterium]